MRRLWLSLILLVAACASQRSTLAWSSAGLATGIASAATGAVLLKMDGTGTCDGPNTCPELYDTKKYGVPLMIGGDVLTLGSLAGLAWAAWRGR